MLIQLWPGFLPFSEFSLLPPWFIPLHFCCNHLPADNVKCRKIWLWFWLWQVWFCPDCDAMLVAEGVACQATDWPGCDHHSSPGIEGQMTVICGTGHQLSLVTVGVVTQWICRVGFSPWEGGNELSPPACGGSFQTTCLGISLQVLQLTPPWLGSWWQCAKRCDSIIVTDNTCTHIQWSAVVP